MKCGRPWPLWAPTAEGVFLAPRRPPVLWGAGGKGAEDRPCSAGERGGAGASSSRRWTASGLTVRRFGLLHRPRGVEVHGTHVGGRCRGVTVRRLRSGRALFRATSSAAVGRCAGLAPAACAAGFMVRWEWAKRGAFRFPKSARAAIAAPRPRRHRPVHGRGHGALHRPHGCSTAQPGC